MTTYAIANETVWPSANDVAQSAGDGKTGKELKLTPWRMAGMRNFVISGFQVPKSSANLDLSVPLGAAFINGYHVNVPGSNTITAGAATSYLYLILTRDGNSKVNGAVFDVQNSQVDNVDYLLIAVLINSAGVLVDTIDARLVTPDTGPYSGPVNVYGLPILAQQGHTLISSNTNLPWFNMYTSFRLKSGSTITPSNQLLFIMSQTVIEIAGKIDARGAGASGGAGGLSPAAGTNGTDSTGGGGGGDGSVAGNAGGAGVLNGFTTGAGGSGGTVGGGNATALSGAEKLKAWMLLSALRGGAGGGGGRGTGGGTGGNGGGTVVLMAPVVILKSTAEIDTRGLAGAAGTGGGNQGGGGGGGGGNIWIVCRHGWWIDEGATTSSGGSTGGAGSGSGGAGGTASSGGLQVMAF